MSSIKFTFCQCSGPGPTFEQSHCSDENMFGSRSNAKLNLVRKFSLFFVGFQKFCFWKIFGESQAHTAVSLAGRLPATKTMSFGCLSAKVEEKPTRVHW